MDQDIKLYESLKSLGYDVSPDSYDGKANTYITYNVEDERPELFGSDKPHSISTYYQIHLYTKTNPRGISKSIREKVFSDGFNYPSLEQFYEPTTKQWHVILSTSIETEE